MSVYGYEESPARRDDRGEPRRREAGADGIGSPELAVRAGAGEVVGWFLRSWTR